MCCKKIFSFAPRVMMASLAEVVLFYPLLPDIFMSLHRLQKSFARRRLRQKNKNVFQQLGGIVFGFLEAVWGGDELRALRTRRKSGGRCTRGDVGVGCSIWQILKHQGFHEEKEFRLLSLLHLEGKRHGETPGAVIQARGSTLIPYVHLQPYADKLPLKSIRGGPKQDFT